MATFDELEAEVGKVRRKVRQLEGGNASANNRRAVDDIVSEADGDERLIASGGGGRVSRSWCVSSVRHVLKNPRYQGRIVWNTKRKVRVPGTNRRIYRHRPESEWVITPAPHLRIVSDELFAAVERRFETTKKLWGWGTRALPAANRSKFICFRGCWCAASAEAVLRWWAAGQTLRGRNMAAHSTPSGVTAFAGIP
jgi:Recombinase